ncbi:aldehyde dehydrogenase family protein [Naasia lichenicola]|uniref:Aldehyde dehydrogenase family protein n=1 Tax=Naasia lichenicola TaxID=2565933 RepID=A0A4S4FRF3_9MICO|nr:aldehyde dehydrogenase family protein [Naasia lichenicola]THG33219.1 aldehyde dehydrogenase family protein [Naasia lichenicola]
MAIAEFSTDESTPDAPTSAAPSSVDLLQYLAGEWREGRGAHLASENPSRPSEIVAAGRAGTVEDVELAVRAADAAKASWAATPPHERGAILNRAARIVSEAATTWGTELAREEGKTLAEGIGEVRRAAQILEHYGHDADREAGGIFSSPRRGERILVTRRPLGTVALITPFNFPIAIPAWKIAPALAYGNTVVWKPAGPVPLLALRLASALHDAGLPPGVLNLVFGEGEVGSALVGHPLVDGVSFTGSTAVGRAVASAGSARGIPVQAELGGKNAAVVLADADLELAAAQVLAGAFNSSGQKCTATSRLVVQREIADEFGSIVAERADALIVGDPLADGVHLGPVISARARDSINAGVARALDEGAHALTRCALELDDDLRPGHFVRPSVLAMPADSSPLWEQELFGPVLAMRAADSVEHAFDLANAGGFGLSAAVFTNDLTRALDSIDRMQVGILHINSETAGADPHVPFGGAKGSSLGPKEQGAAAREFYTSSTTVYLRGGS